MSSLAFTLEPPHRDPTLLGKSLLIGTLGSATALKVTRYALWSVIFSSLGFAFSATTMPTVSILYGTALALFPLALETQRLFDELLCREFNQKLVKIIVPLDEIPTITPGQGKIEKIRLSQFTEKIAKGTLEDGSPFFAFKIEKEGVEYIDCFYRDGSFTWKNFNKVHAKKQDETVINWPEWFKKPSLFPSDKPALTLEDFKVTPPISYKNVGNSPPISYKID